MERIKTNILGFDDLIEGGIPSGSSILLTGPCGAGKHVFGFEFLYKNKEPSIFYTFERDETFVKDSMNFFSWDIEQRIKEKQLHIVTSELYQFETFISDLEDAIDKMGATRLLLDSLTIIGQFFDSNYKMRKGLIELRKVLKSANCTSLMLTEVPDKSDKLSTFGLEEFVLDGVIMLNLIRKDSEVMRSISIRKLMGTNYDPSEHPYEYTKKGIKVHKIREIL